MSDVAGPDPLISRRGGYAHEYLAPVLFVMIGEVRRAEARVHAAAGKTAANDPEAIHDFRVALRRLRTVLRPARRVFGGRRLREIGAELQRFAQATGALRDEEVLRETLSALDLQPRAQHDLAGWLVQRAKQERARRRGVVAILLTRGGPGAPSLGAALARLERRIGKRRRDEIRTYDLAKAAIDGAFAAVESRASADPRDPQAMHELRILCKRLRYTAELFAPVLGEAGEPVAKSAARLQKRLGELHDIDEALIRIGRARGLGEPSVASIRRALHRARGESADRTRSALAEEMSRIREAVAPPI